jgi:outer membrane protein OmpA-like peptidoglycan-associated protein
LVGLTMLSGCTSFQEGMSHIRQDVRDVFATKKEGGTEAVMSGVAAPLTAPGDELGMKASPMMNAPLGIPAAPLMGGIGLPSNQGGFVTNDPSVTVFPLDGGAAPMPQYGGQMPLSNVMSNMGGAAGGFDGSSMMQSGGNNIYFRDGSSRLGSGDKQKLSQIAEQAKFAPVSRITVAGFASRPTQAGTNSPTAHTLNLKESANRSVAVSNQLIKNGVPAEKIKTVSWGATKASGNHSQDRRVDIIMGER